MRRDLKEDIDIKPSIEPVSSQTTTTSGTTVSLTTGPYNAANGYVHVGSYNDGTAKYRLQEKNSGGTFSNVSSGDIDGSTTITVSSTGDANSRFEVGYRGSKTQLRWKITSVANMTNGHNVAAYVAAGAKRNK